MFNTPQYQFLRIGSRQGPRYRQNGTGRDQYIAQGPGMSSEQTNLSHNMAVTGQKIKITTSNGWNFSSNTNNKQFRGARSESNHQYHSNGSGRDGYITANSGGFIRNFGGNRLNNHEAYFKSTLRDSSQQLSNQGSNELLSQNKIDCQAYGQIWRNPTLTSQNFKRGKTQFDLTQRLSKPKNNYQIVHQDSKNLKQTTKSQYETTQNGVQRLRPQSAAQNQLKKGRSISYHPQPQDFLRPQASLELNNNNLKQQNSIDSDANIQQNKIQVRGKSQQRQRNSSLYKQQQQLTEKEKQFNQVRNNSQILKSQKRNNFYCTNAFNSTFHKRGNSTFY